MAKAQPPDTNSLKLAWRDLKAEAHGVGAMITVVIILILVVTALVIGV